MQSENVTVGQSLTLSTDPTIKAEEAGTNIPAVLFHILNSCLMSLVNLEVVRFERDQPDTFSTLVNKVASLLCAYNVCFVNCQWPMVLARGLGVSVPKLICGAMSVALYTCLMQMWWAQNQVVILLYFYTCRFPLMAGLREDLARFVLVVGNLMLALMFSLLIFMAIGDDIGGYRICLGDDSFEGSDRDISSYFYLFINYSTFAVHAAFVSLIVLHKRHEKSTAPPRSIMLRANSLPPNLRPLPPLPPPPPSLLDCRSSLLQVCFNATLPAAVALLCNLTLWDSGLLVLYRLFAVYAIVLVLPLSMFVSNRQLRKMAKRDIQTVVYKILRPWS